MADDSTFRADPHETACSGPCSRCGCDHALPVGPAREAAFRLMGRLEDAGRMDIDLPAVEADPRCALDYLSGPARGQMFGVMVYRTAEGEVREAKAFSGQYNSMHHVPGWVPPVVDAQEMERISRDTEREIKRLGRRIAELPEGADEIGPLKEHRANLSRELMKQIHGLYRLTNFRGKTALLTEVFQGPGAPPTGAGDCCAPKLFNFAALNGHAPLGLAEFFFGRTNRSGTRIHGRFYPACTDKCRPILGFMLCGLPGAVQP